MIELLRTADPVLLTWLEARLAAEGVGVVIFDQHTSAAYGGALTAIERRVMVADDDADRARFILADVPAAPLDGHRDDSA
jgi:hypothetical protein